MNKNKVKIQEGRKLAIFSVQSYHWDVAYQGWSNSATHTFNIYFFQEKSLYLRFQSLRNKKDVFNVRRVINLFNNAQNNNLMEQIDEDCVGAVNVIEIIENYCNENYDRMDLDIKERY